MYIGRVLFWLLAAAALLGPASLVTAGPGEDQAAPDHILVAVDDDLIVFRDKRQENWTNLFFDTLYQWVPGKTGAELKPCIAQGWPEWSEDKLTCTIKIRPDAVFDAFAGFPEGKSRRVEALDAINAVKWMAKGGRKEKLTYDAVLRGRIVGLDDFAANASKTSDWTYDDQSAEVAGLVEKDKYTLQITLTRPCGHLPVVLAHPQLVLWPLEAMNLPRDKRDEKRPFVGTGPMLPTEFDTGSPNMTPRQSYFADPATPPPLRRAFLRTGSVKAALQALKQAELHYWNVADQDIMEANRLREEHATIHFGDAEALYYLAFNMQRPAWGADGDDGRALRRALCDLIGREALAAETRKKEPWRATRNLLPPIRGVSAPAEVELAEAIGLDAVIQLLKNSPLRQQPDKDGNVFTLEVLCAEPSYDPKSLKLLDEPLRKAGIAITWKQPGNQQFLDALAAGNYDAVLFGWANDWADPLCMLEKLHSRNAKAAPELSVPCAYKNQVFDKLLEKAETIPVTPAQAAERNQAICECLKHLAKDLPYVPIAVPQRAWVAALDIEVPQVPVSARNSLRFLKFK